MFKKIIHFVWDGLDGKKRRIAVLGGKIGALGVLTNSKTLQIVGGAIVVLFGSADYAQASVKKVQQLKTQKKDF
jgi:hypothetical protein